MAERVDETIDAEEIKKQGEAETPDFERREGETDAQYRDRMTNAIGKYSGAEQRMKVPDTSDRQPKASRQKSAPIPEQRIDTKNEVPKPQPKQRTEPTKEAPKPKQTEKREPQPERGRDLSRLSKLPSEPTKIEAMRAELEAMKAKNEAARLELELKQSSIAKMQAQIDSKNAQIATGNAQLSEMKAQAISKTRDEIVNLKNERFVVLNNDGTKRFADHASGPSGGLLPKQWIGKLEGSELVHNHPSGLTPTYRGFGSSLSSVDITTAAREKMSAIRAVTPNRDYVMKPGPSGWPDEKTLKMAIKNAEVSVERELFGRVKDGKMTTTQANLLHHHRMWKKVANETGMEYITVRRSR
jgi:hypothetical protein